MQKKTRLARVPALATLLAGLLAGCGDDGARAAAAGHCVEGGRFRGELYGDLAVGIDWQGAALACEGMPRPQGEGARLRFSGPLADGDRRLALIIALKSLRPGQTATELPVTLTLMEEDAGRFWSSAGHEHCWADVRRHEPLAGPGQQYAVAGIVYCLSPLVATAGNGSIRLGELEYAGRIDWQETD